MADSENIIVNPLVLFNIADHYKRKKAEFYPKSFRIIGTLYGTQNGHTMKITLSNPLKINKK
jgi:hypothetical protein